VANAINDVLADVVPRSEVERLIGKFECFLCHATGGRLSKYTYDLGTMESVATDCINETYNDGYGEGYKDCAREIFEEIESVLSYSVYPQIRADGMIKTIKSKDLTVRFEDYETIKKKYTEGENEDQRGSN
jgi:hypothetical protein